MSPTFHLLYSIRYKLKKMNNIPQNILEILSAYISQEVTENEFAALKEWIDECPENKHAFAEYLLFYKKTRQVVFAVNSYKDHAWDTIVSKLEQPLQSKEEIQKTKSKVRFLHTATTILKYAAVVLVLISVGYFYFGKGENVKPIFENSVASETAITLQLANGDIQTINEDGTTQVVDVNGNVVGTQKGNQLIYSNASAKDTLVYNTIKVPYGKRFELTLSDGTIPLHLRLDLIPHRFHHYFQIRRN